MSQKLLEGQIALVTGSSRGIGQGIARSLGEAGAIVIGTATTEKGAQVINDFFKKETIQGSGMVLNVTDQASIDTLIANVKSQFGPISILVNNAAINHDNLILRMKEEEWLKVIETDLSSIFRLTKVCLKDMIKARFGRIINIGSVVGATGNPGQANYCAAKAGLLGFSKAAALEVGSRNITVNTVAPGFIETDMTQALSEDQRDLIFQRIPMKRMGTLQDIGEAVVYLASQKASYITGQTLHVNGGMYMN